MKVLLRKSHEEVTRLIQKELREVIYDDYGPKNAENMKELSGKEKSKEAIASLQTMLNLVEIGSVAQLADDGIFGTKTFGALVAFQKQYDLEVDWIVWHETFSKLKALIDGVKQEKISTHALPQGLRFREIKPRVFVHPSVSGIKIRENQVGKSLKKEVPWVYKNKSATLEYNSIEDAESKLETQNFELESLRGKWNNKKAISVSDANKSKLEWKTIVDLDNLWLAQESPLYIQARAFIEWSTSVLVDGVNGPATRRIGRSLWIFQDVSLVKNKEQVAPKVESTHSWDFNVDFWYRDYKEARNLWHSWGVRINMDCNQSSARKIIPPLIVIPDGSPEHMRVAAEHYVQKMAELHNDKFDRGFMGKVVESGENWRGLDYTMHTEWWSIDDQKMVKYLKTEEWIQHYRNILTETLWTIPGAQFWLPHWKYSKKWQVRDPGAVNKESWDSEVSIAKIHLEGFRNEALLASR